ncbi:MAG: hypothetical protein KC897_04225 [Candidatus Omnitrophica bacterium]|nr:hypothetical protein [Candidatus Omnitrophota bacterium]MCB9721718.1 hypothetical protein [Candidatus Omnitrophota bacterium]
MIPSYAFDLPHTNCGRGNEHMIMGLQKWSDIGRNTVVWLVICSFTVSLVAPQAAFAQTALMPQPGARVETSENFTPPIVTGIQLSPEDPLQINFLIDTGDDQAAGDDLTAASQKLIQYFFAALTVPENELWVNLSPYEENRIIADPLSHTAMGRDMLAQDYLLKQLSASMMYPEDELGRRFWDRVQQKALQRFGTTEIPMNTFNKIWIIPERAQIYVNGPNVFIADSHLKVMLEEDYLALRHHAALNSGATDDEVLTGISDDVVREILIPEIEREINSGRNFAPLRQIFHSLILAAWYKKNLRDSILGRLYVNRNKVDGIEIEDRDVKESIYNQYLAALQKGVFDYIREDQDPDSGTPIPRRYFSGGVDMAQLSAASITEGMTEKLRTAALTRNYHTVQTYAGLRQNEGDDQAVFASTREEHLLNRLSWASPRMRQNAIRRLLAIGENAIPIVAGQLHVLEKRLLRLSSDPGTQALHHLHRAILLGLYAQTIDQTEQQLAQQPAEIDRPLDELSEDELSPLSRRSGKYYIRTATGYDEWDPATLEPGITRPNPQRIALAHKMSRLVATYRRLLRDRIAAELPQNAHGLIGEEHIDRAEALVGNIDVGFDGKTIRITPAPNALIIDRTIRVPKDAFGAMLMDAFADALQRGQDVFIYLDREVIKQISASTDPAQARREALDVAQAKLGRRTGNLTMFRAGGSIYLDTSADLHDQFTFSAEAATSVTSDPGLVPIIIHRLPGLSSGQSIDFPEAAFETILRETFASAQKQATKVYLFLDGERLRSIDPGVNLDAVLDGLKDQLQKELAARRGKLTIYSAGSSIYLNTSADLPAQLSASGLTEGAQATVVVPAALTGGQVDEALLLSDTDFSTSMREAQQLARESERELLVYIDGEVVARYAADQPLDTILPLATRLVAKRLEAQPGQVLLYVIENGVYIDVHAKFFEGLPISTDLAMLSDAADRLEIKPREYRLVPEREENERNNERRASIEIRQRLGLLYGESEAIMALRRNAETDDDLAAIERREQQLILDMRQLFNEMPVKIVLKKGYDFYSEALKDLKRDRRRISAQLRRADAAKDRDALARLNLLAIRTNRLMIKTQLMVAGLLQTGQSRDGIRHPTPAMNALEGAINSASALEIELEYRIQRLRGRKFRRVIETQDWVGNRVRTYRLGTFDIDIEKPQSGEDEPRVTVRQKRPVNVHTRLDRIRRLANKGEIDTAVKQINFLLGIYRLRYFKTLETYKDIETDLRALRDIITGLPEGEALAKGELKDNIKDRVTALTERIQSPKLMVWDDVRYRSRRKAFEGQIRKIASELAEYMVILKNKTDLDYYAKKLKSAQQRQERGRAVTLSQRDRVVISEKLEELQKWTERGFVESKVTAAIDFTPVIELIAEDAFKRAELHLQRIITRLNDRLTDIERIATNLKESAASLFAEFRRQDIIDRSEEITQAINDEEFEAALQLLNDLEDDYFTVDNPEPGLIRAARRIKEARAILVKLPAQAAAGQEVVDEVYGIVWNIKEDTQHQTRYRLNITNEKGKQRPYYVEPGISVEGLLRVGRRDIDRTVVLVNGKTVPRRAYRQTQIADDSRVELRRDEAMIVIEQQRLQAALAAARTYAETYNQQYEEKLPILVLLNHAPLVRWDTAGTPEGLLTFVEGKLKRANPTNQPGEVSISTLANRVSITWKPAGAPELNPLDEPEFDGGNDAAMLSAADRIRLLFGIQSMNDTLSRIDSEGIDAVVEKGVFLDNQGEAIETSAIRLWTAGPDVIDRRQIALTRQVQRYLADQFALAPLFHLSESTILPRAEAPYLWLVDEKVISGMYLEIPAEATGEKELRAYVRRARGMLETWLATISTDLPRELLAGSAADRAVLASVSAAPEVLTQRLEDGALNLSQRIINLLKLNRIITVGDLTELSLHRLRGITNIGPAGRKEIVDALAERGLSLRRTAFIRSPNQYQINELLLEAYFNLGGPRHRTITVTVNGEPAEYSYDNRGAIDAIGLDVYRRIQTALEGETDAFIVSLDNADIRVQADAALLAKDDDLQAWMEQREIPDVEQFLENLAWARGLNDPRLKLSDPSLAIVRDAILSNLIYGHPLDVLAVRKVGLALQQYRDLIGLSPQGDFIQGMQDVVIRRARESLENRIRYLLFNNDQRRLARALLQFDGTNIDDVIGILRDDPQEYQVELSRAEAREFYQLLTPLLNALPLLNDIDDLPDAPEARALRSSPIGQLVEQLYQRRHTTADLLVRYIVDEFSALRLILQGDNLANLSRYTEDAALLADGTDRAQRLRLRRLREQIEAALAEHTPVPLEELQPTTVTDSQRVLEYLSRFFPERTDLSDRAAISDKLLTWFFADGTDFAGRIVGIVSEDGTGKPLGYLDQNVAELFALPYIEADAAVLIDAVDTIAERLGVEDEVVATALGEALSIEQAVVRWEVLADDMQLDQRIRAQISNALRQTLTRHRQPYDAAAITRDIFETEHAFVAMLPESLTRDVVLSLNASADGYTLDYPIGLMRSLFHIISSSIDWRLFAERVAPSAAMDTEEIAAVLADIRFNYLYTPYVREYVTLNGMVIAVKMRFPSLADFVNFQRGTRPDGRLINRGTPLEIVTRDDPQNPVRTIFDRVDDDLQPSAIYTGAGFFDAEVIREITFTDYSVSKDMAMLNRRDVFRLGLGLTGLGAVIYFLMYDPLDFFANAHAQEVRESALRKFESDFDRQLAEISGDISRRIAAGNEVPQTLIQRLKGLKDGADATLEMIRWVSTAPAEDLRRMIRVKQQDLEHWAAIAAANQGEPANWREAQTLYSFVNQRFLDAFKFGPYAPQSAQRTVEDLVVDYHQIQDRAFLLRGLLPADADRLTELMIHIDETLTRAVEYLDALEKGKVPLRKAALSGGLPVAQDSAVFGRIDGPSDMATFAELTVPLTEQVLKLESPVEMRVQISDGEVRVDTGENGRYAEYAGVLIEEIERLLKRPETDPAVLERLRDFRIVITTDTTAQSRDDIVYKLPLAENGNPFAAHSSVGKKVLILHPYFFSDKVDKLRRLLLTHELISRIGRQTADQEAATEYTHEYLREEFAAADMDIPDMIRASRELSQPEKVFLSDIRRQRNYRSGLNAIPDEQISPAVKDALLAATQFLELYAAAADDFEFDGIAARQELADNPEILAAFDRYLAGESTAENVQELIEHSGTAWLNKVFNNAVRHVKSSNIYTAMRKDYDPVTLVISGRALTDDPRVVDYVFSYRPGYFYALTQIVDRPNGTGSLAQGGIRYKVLKRRDEKGRLMPEDRVAYNHFQNTFAEVDLISRSKFARNTITQTPFSGAKTVMSVFPDSKNIKTVLLKSLARSYVDAGVASRYVIGTESGMTAKDQDTLAQAIGTRYRDHLRNELELMKTIPSIGEDLSKIKSTSQYGMLLAELEDGAETQMRFLHDPLMDSLRQRVVASMHLGQQNGGTSLVKLFSSRLESEIARTIGSAATGRLTDTEFNALKEWSLTAFSAAMSIEAIDEYLPDRDLRSRKIGIRGATTGGSLALMLTRMGYQVVAIEDINGTVYKKEGFSVRDLQRLDNIALNERNVLKWMPAESTGVRHLPKGSLGDKDMLDLDILISMAPGHQLDEGAIDRLRSLDDDPDRDPLIYIEGGFNSINGYERTLHRKGILAFSATSVGFGGAYGSYLEDYIKHRFTTEQLQRIIVRSEGTDVVTSPAIRVNDRFTVTNYTGSEVLGEIVMQDGRVIHSTVPDILAGTNLDLFEGRLMSQGIQLPYRHRDQVKTLIWDNFVVKLDSQGKITASNHPDLKQGNLAVFIDPVQEIRVTAYQDIKGIAKRMNTMVMELARNGADAEKLELKMMPSQAVRKVTKMIAAKKRELDTSDDERVEEAIQRIVDKFEADGFFFPLNVARKIAIKRLVSASDLSIKVGKDTYVFNAEGRLERRAAADPDDVLASVRMREALSGSFDSSLKTARMAEASLREQESRALQAQNFIGLDKRLKTSDAAMTTPVATGASIEEQVLGSADTQKRKTRPEALRYLNSQRDQKTNRAGLDQVLADVEPRRRDILLGAATFLEILSHYEVKHNRGEYFDAIAAIEELVAHPQIAAAMIRYLYNPRGEAEALEELLAKSDTQWLTILYERAIKNITSTSADVVEPEKREETSGGSREAIAIRFKGVPLTGFENKKEIVFIYLPDRFYAITQLVDLSEADHTKGGIRYAEPVARANDPQKRNIDEVAHDIMKGAYEDLNNLSVSQYSKNVLAGIGYAGAKTYFGVNQDATSLKDDLLRTWARAMVDVGLMEVYDGGPDVGMSSDNQETIIAGIVRRYTMHLMNEVRTMHAHGVDIFNLNLTSYGRALAEIERESGRKFLDDSLIGYMRKRLLLELPKGKENGSVVIERVFNRKLKDEIVKIIGSAVTGGSAKVGAISHVELAVTGDSTWHSIKTILEYKGIHPATQRAAVVGAGDVGGSIALKMVRGGIRVVAISDINGVVYKPEGFTVAELQDLNNISPGERNVLQWMPEQEGVQHLKGAQILDTEVVDINLLVPAAMGGFIKKPLQQRPVSIRRALENANLEGRVTEQMMEELSAFLSEYEGDDELIIGRKIRDLLDATSDPARSSYSLTLGNALDRLEQRGWSGVPLLKADADEPELEDIIIIEGSNNAFIGVEQELKEAGILAVSGMSVNFGGVKGSTKEAMLKHQLTVRELRTITLRNADGDVIPTETNTEVTEVVNLVTDKDTVPAGQVIIHNGIVVASDIDEITIGANVDPLNGRLFHRGDDLGYAVASLRRRLAWDNYAVEQQGHGLITSSNHPDVKIGEHYEYLDPLDQIKIELYDEIAQIARRNNIMVMELSEKYDMTPTEAVVRLAKALGQRKAEIYAATDGEDLIKRDAIVARFKKDKFFMADHIMRNIAAIQVATESNLSVPIAEETVTFDANGYIVDGAILAAERQAEPSVVRDARPYGAPDMAVLDEILRDPEKILLVAGSAALAGLVGYRMFRRWQNFRNRDRGRDDQAMTATSRTDAAVTPLNTRLRAKVLTLIGGKMIEGGADVGALDWITEENIAEATRLYRRDGDFIARVRFAPLDRVEIQEIPKDQAITAEQAIKIIEGKLLFPPPQYNSGWITKEHIQTVIDSKGYVTVELDMPHPIAEDLDWGDLRATGIIVSPDPEGFADGMRGLIQRKAEEQGTADDVSSWITPWHVEQAQRLYTPVREDRGFDVEIIASEKRISLRRSDQAQTAEEAPGGIDFDTRNMNLQITGDAFEFTTPEGGAAPLNPLQIRGVQPVIINITPLPNLIPLLGLEDNGDGDTRSVQQDPAGTPAGTARLSRRTSPESDARASLIQSLASVL